MMTNTIDTTIEKTVTDIVAETTTEIVEPAAKAVPTTITNFNELDIPATILQSLERMGITTPTPVQAGAIPAALLGQDILASAQTGSGKTLGFLLPLVLKIMNNPGSKALVLLPTRELAMQVQDTLTKLTNRMQGFNPILIMGGDSMFKQLGRLKTNPNIIIGTPGRICDHLNRRTLHLANVNFFVLDEMDRMLDMGFTQQLEMIYEQLQGERQTLMFSATMPANVERLTKKYLKNPVRVSLGNSLQAAKEIKQENIMVPSQNKFARLEMELDERQGSIIVFAKTKHGVDKLVAKLSQNNHNVEAIHGGLAQRKRERVIHAFRGEKVRILVATDVAARGIDVPHVKHVINYDLPQCGEDYIHRIGRTGRAGVEGTAVTFVAPEDNRRWREIQHFMQAKDGSAPVKFDKSADRSYDRSGGKPFGKKPAHRGQSGGEAFGFQFQRDKKKDPRKEEFGSWDVSAPRKEFAPRGDRPFQPRGERADRPFAPRGDRPFGQKREFGNREGGNRDGNKREFGSDFNRDGNTSSDRPRREFAPRGERTDRPFAPRGDRPFAPRGDRPFQPRGERSDAPRGDRPQRDFAPRGERSDRPFTPRGERSDAPRGDRPQRDFAPRGERSDRPFAPRGDKPFAPKKSFGASAGGAGKPAGGKPFVKKAGWAKAKPKAGGKRFGDR
jgi:ATP-dependent RNA helicase DeaD